MKKTLLLTAAATMAFSASALSLPLKPERPSSLHHPQGQTEEMANRLKSQKGVKTFKMAERGESSAVRRAAGKKVAGPSGSIINEVPAGVMSEWSKSCECWYVYWGYLYNSQMDGQYQQMVEAEDGSVYLNMHACGYPMPETWVKGTKDADGNLVIPSYQLVEESVYDDESMHLAMIALPCEITEESVYYDFADSLTLEYDAATGTYSTSEDIIWGVCEWDAEYEEWYWTGYGDCDIKLKKMTDTPIEAPEGLKTEQWSLLDGYGSGYFVSVGFDNNDVWVKGIVANNPDSWVKGTIEEGTGKVLFEAGQFLGLSDSFTWSYLYGGGIKTVWDEEWEEEVEVADIQGGLIMNYDSRGQRLLPENYMFITSSKAATPEDYSSLSLVDYMLDFCICLQHRDPAALPSAPYGLEFDDSYFNTYGDSDFYFYLSPLDVNGDLLNTENLYYRFYIDGEVFTFYGDEYYGMDEDGQELVNVNFNSGDIFASGISHCIYVYATGFESAGIQAVYLQPSEDGGEPTELCSEIVEFDLDDPSAVNTLGGKAAASTYFDLQGRKVNGSGNDKGIYIRVDRMADGSVKAVKVAK